MLRVESGVDGLHAETDTGLGMVWVEKALHGITPAQRVFIPRSIASLGTVSRSSAEAPESDGEDRDSFTNRDPPIGLRFSGAAPIDGDRVLADTGT